MRARLLQARVSERRGTFMLPRVSWRGFGGNDFSGSGPPFSVMNVILHRLVIRVPKDRNQSSLNVFDVDQVVDLSRST